MTGPNCNAGPKTFNLQDSLEDSRRTADAGVGQFQSGFDDNIFFLQQPDRGKNWGCLARIYGRTCAVGYYTDGAGSGFCLRRMGVSKLGRCHPTHQG